MKCDKMKELLSAYLDGELSVKEAAEVRRHLTECLDCEEAALELDKVRQMVRELPRLKAPAKLAERVSQQLERTKQQTTNIFWQYRPAFLRDSASLRWAMRGLATAAAAFLVVYVGLVLIPNKGSPRSSESGAGEQAKSLPRSVNNEDAIENRNLDKALTLSKSDEVKEELLVMKQSLKAKAQEHVETYNLKCAEDSERPVAFSQEIRIISKDKNTTLQSIRDIASESCGEYLAKDSDGINFGVVLSKNVQITADKTNEYAKGYDSNQPKREYKIKVILPIDQREAFIEQLKIHKIGTVKIARLTTSQTGTITANKILQGQVVSHVTEQLRNEVELLKEREGGVGGGAIADSKKLNNEVAVLIERGEVNHNKALKQPSPNDLKAKGSKPAGSPLQPPSTVSGAPAPAGNDSGTHERTMRARDPQTPVAPGDSRGGRTDNVALAKTPVPPAAPAKESARAKYSQKDELKKIDNSLIILHDLEQQKKAATQGLVMEKEKLSEEAGLKDKSADEEKGDANYGKNQKQASNLPLIEMIIILEEE